MLLLATPAQLLRVGAAAPRWRTKSLSTLLSRWLALARAGVARLGSELLSAATAA